MKGPIIFLALPMLAACAGGEGVGNGAVAGLLPPAEIRCAGYTTGLTLLASLQEIDGEALSRGSVLMSFGALAGCSDPSRPAVAEAWMQAVDAWNLAVKDRG